MLIFMGILLIVWGVLVGFQIPFPQGAFTTLLMSIAGGYFIAEGMRGRR